jgi:hypothetical protein
VIWIVLWHIIPRAVCLPVVLFVFFFVPPSLWNKVPRLFCLYNEHLEYNPRRNGQDYRRCKACGAEEHCDVY